MDEQLLKARAVAVLAKVLRKDELGRAIEVDPGAGSQHRVKIDWGVDTLYTTCTCAGSNRGVCYHQIGAVVRAFEEIGGMVAVSRALGNVTMLQRTGGKLWTVRSMGKPVYVLVKGELKTRAVYDEVELPGELRDVWVRA